jgi:hypothetical protein
MTEPDVEPPSPVRQAALTKAFDGLASEPPGPDGTVES